MAFQPTNPFRPANPLALRQAARQRYVQPAQRPAPVSAPRGPIMVDSPLKGLGAGLAGLGKGLAQAGAYRKEQSASDAIAALYNTPEEKAAMAQMGGPELGPGVLKPRPTAAQMRAIAAQYPGTKASALAMQNAQAMQVQANQQQTAKLARDRFRLQQDTAAWTQGSEQRTLNETSKFLAAQGLPTLANDVKMGSMPAGIAVKIASNQQALAAYRSGDTSRALNLTAPGGQNVTLADPSAPSGATVQRVIPGMTNGTTVGPVPAIKGRDVALPPAVQQQRVNVAAAVAEQKGKQELTAKAVERTRQSKEMIELVTEARDILPGATGSALGNLVDEALGLFGVSTPGAEKAQKLKVIQSALLNFVPRMEGPQSNADVALYKEATGLIGDPTIPVERREAALQTILRLQIKYTKLGQGDVVGSAPSAQAERDIAGQGFVAVGEPTSEDWEQNPSGRSR